MKKSLRHNIDKELLDDEDFIQSTLHPSPGMESYWNSLAEDGCFSEKELYQARHFMRTVQKPTKVMSLREKNNLWTTIEIENKEKLRKQIRRRNIYLWSIVASFLTLVGIFLFQLNDQPEETQDISLIAQDLQTEGVNDEKIQLVLGGKNIYELDEKTADIVLDKEGSVQVNSRLLAEETQKQTNKSPLKYNQLIIPKGARSKLTLSDGTIMNINSGTRVIFPEVFASNEREIFVDGEVFLDVTPDNKAPFIVKTNKMNVRVLGTSFNVSAYEEEETQSIVLVSGSVTVHSEDNAKIVLTPNQMATYTNEGHSVSVVNVAQYISWKDGYLNCNKEDLPALMRKLARFYGKTITCDPSLKSCYGVGKLDLKSNFEEIINGLKELFPISIESNEGGYHIKKKS